MMAAPLQDLEQQYLILEILYYSFEISVSFFEYSLKFTCSI